MTRAKLFAATAAVWSIVLIAAGATFRDTHVDALPLSAEIESGEPVMKKGDRLPWSARVPLATAAQPEVASSVVSPP
jgi:hypothetical protein